MIEYAINEDFRNYVDKYCKKHKISVAEALRHKMVCNVREYYKERRIARE